MPIDPADVLVMVFEGRKINPALKQWIRRFPQRKVLTPPTGLRDFLCLWRNHQVAAFLADPAGPPWLLLLDDDGCRRAPAAGPPFFSPAPASLRQSSPVTGPAIA